MKKQITKECLLQEQERLEQRLKQKNLGAGEACSLQGSLLTIRKLLEMIG